jgi:hypothetical protein
MEQIDRDAVPSFPYRTVLGVRENRWLRGARPADRPRRPPDDLRLGDRGLGADRSAVAALVRRLTRDWLDRWGGLCAELGLWMDGGPPEPVDIGDDVHVQVCEGTVMERKFAALRAQTSQPAGLIGRVGELRYRQWWRTEAFLDAATVADREEAA